MVVGVLQDEGNNPYPVAATGFLLGSQFTIFLYGLHVCQVARYYNRFGKTDKNKYRYLLVPLVILISSAHIGMIIFSVHHYFIQGFLHPTIWDTFYGGLSGQDFVIPIMSFVSHLFFGHRIYVLRHVKFRYWMAFICFAAATCAVGIAFATLARIWSMHPFEPEAQFEAMSIGPAADSLPTAWLSCAALIDGGLTATLLYTVLRERRQHHEHTRQLLHNIAGLTLETVLLTHIIGATLFVLWLTSRTRTNAFWFFIEIIAETYALSILFTLNSRSRFRRAARPNSEHMIDRQLNQINRLEDGDSGPLYPPQLESASPPDVASEEIAVADVASGRRGARISQHIVWSDTLDTEKSHANSLQSSDEEKVKNSTSSSSDDVGESRLFLPNLSTEERTPMTTAVTGHRRFRSLPSALR